MTQTAPTVVTDTVSGSGGGAVGRRERKKMQTRQALHAHALRLFAERGFDATTVQDITEAADVAPRTFFLHYASKEDVLLGDSAQRTEAFVAMLHERPAHETPFEAIRATLIGMLSGTVVDHDELVLRARLMEEAPSVLARNLEQYAHTARLLSTEIGRRAGQDPDRDLYPSLLASAVMNALATAIGLWYRRGAEDDLTDLVIEAIDRTGSGLSR